jgi:hypothetical protein
MLIFLNLNRASIYNELVAFNLVPRPEKLTELYFNTVDLPDAVTANQEIHFAFVIHNLETMNYQYTYVVLVNTHGTRHIIDHGTVLVLSNQYYIKKVEIRLARSSEKRNVIVELTNKQQSIDFWI